MVGSLNLAGIHIAGTVRRGARYLATLTAAVGLCGIQLAVAEDFAALFDANYAGISLDTGHLGERQLVDHTDNLDQGSTDLPGFPMSQEELALVLRTVDPVGSGQSVIVYQGSDPGVIAEQSKRPLRLRLLDWIKQGSQQTGIFSALVREKDEPGMRLEIDPDSEQVVVEYRIGF